MRLTHDTNTLIYSGTGPTAFGSPRVIPLEARASSYGARPLVQPDRVIVQALNELYAYDRTSGERLWKAPGGEAPVFTRDGESLITGHITEVWSLDCATGRERVRMPTAGGVRDGFARFGGEIFVPLGGGMERRQAYGLDGDLVFTGARWWSVPAIRDDVNPPTFIVQADNEVRAWKSAKRWAWRVKLNQPGTPSYGEGKVAVFARHPQSRDQGQFHVLDADTGAVLWTLDAPYQNTSPCATIAGGRVVVNVPVGYRQYLRAYDAASGALVWEREGGIASGTRPAVCGEHLYVWTAANKSGVAVHRLSDGERLDHVEFDFYANSAADITVFDGALWVMHDQRLIEIPGR